ncbi:unnamed protein product [Calypogeia fissa]
MATAMASIVRAAIAPQQSRTRSMICPGVKNGLLNLGFDHRMRATTGWQKVRAEATPRKGTATVAAGGGPWRGGEAAVSKDAAGVIGWLREKSMFSILTNLEDCSLGGEEEKLEGIAVGIIGAALLLFLTFSSAGPAAAETAFKPYYGTAASASSYGGYGGNSNKQTTAEYIFEYPEGWKEKTITKIEKGTNGTDAEFDNPKHKQEKVYVTYLAGLRALAPIDKVLNNLALSDPVLQDIIAYAAGNIKSSDRTDSNGQQYYDYEIDSPVANVLVSVTCAKNKLYAHFVKAGPSDWARDEDMLRHLHESFQTVGSAPLGY